jgi:sugar phosphate isomerase/epimerase
MPMLPMIAAIAIAQDIYDKIDPTALTNGLAIGCQAWTFNHFTAFQAIEKTALAGGKCIEFFPGQPIGDGTSATMGPDMPEDSVAHLKEQLKKFGVTPTAYGVTGIDREKNQARKLFHWAQSLQIRIINTESVDALDTIEAMVAETRLRVGFHDHPKNGDPNYRMWDPSYVAGILKDRDHRIGACADIGHWVRSGVKPIDALRILKGRIISCHMKDLNEFSPSGHDVPFGTGVSGIGQVLDELKRQRFEGSISVEYEWDWDTSLPEVSQCIGFMRGYTVPH